MCHASIIKCPEKSVFVFLIIFIGHRPRRGVGHPDPPLTLFSHLPGCWPFGSPVYGLASHRLSRLRFQPLLPLRGISWFCSGGRRDRWEACDPVACSKMELCLRLLKPKALCWYPVGSKEIAHKHAIGTGRKRHVKYEQVQTHRPPANCRKPS